MGWLKKIVRPKSPTETFVASLLVWNPLIAAAFVLVLTGTDDFARRWAASSAISEMVGAQCFLGAHVVHWLETALRRRPPPARGKGFSFFLGAAMMPVALPLGFSAGRLVASALGLGAEWVPPTFRSYRLGIGIGLVYLSLYFFHWSQTEARQTALEATAKLRELENLRLRAQLSALTAEMNPHLLFNALNTIASLVREDPERAEEIVVRLADLYRGVLVAARAATHPLEDELRLCDAYLHVEHARFGDRLVREIDIDPAIDTRGVYVPVLVLQPFVENAVKHGLSRRARGGKVRLELRKDGERLHMTVDDDGVGSSAEGGTGKGIANCKDRLALTYGARASLEVGARSGGGTRVVVSIPMEARACA